MIRGGPDLPTPTISPDPAGACMVPVTVELGPRNMKMDIEKLFSDAIRAYVAIMPDNDETIGGVTIFAHHDGFALAAPNFGALHRNGMPRAIVTGDEIEAMEWARDYFLTDDRLASVAVNSGWTDADVEAVQNITLIQLCKANGVNDVSQIDIESDTPISATLAATIEAVLADQFQAA